MFEVTTFEVRPDEDKTSEETTFEEPSSSLLLSSLELSDTQVYEPSIRARLGTAARLCTLDPGPSTSRASSATRTACGHTTFEVTCFEMTTFEETTFEVTPFEAKLAADNQSEETTFLSDTLPPADTPSLRMCSV